MAKTSSSKKKNIVLVFLVLAVIISGCIAAVGFYVKTAVPEATVELPEEQKASLTAEPDKDGFAAYLGMLVAKTADSDRVKTKIENNLSIDDDSVSMDASDADTGVLKFALQSLLGKAGEQYENYDGKFGDGFNAVPEISFTSADITEFSFEQGEAKEGDDGSKKEPNFFYFKADLDGKNESIAKAFKSDKIDAVISETAKTVSDMITVKSYELTDVKYHVEGKTNRLNDELQELKLITDYSVKLNAEFIGDYAALGAKTIAFNYRVENKYGYTWAGLEIDEDMIIIEQGEDKQLSVNAVIEEGAANDEFMVIAVSSDESIAKITKDGMVTGVKTSDKPVTVKMTLEYKGNVYTDECQVYVVVHAKNARTNPDSVSLGVGETEQLTCTVTPEDATLKDVLWFSEDESIATVSDDGTVTAVKSGTVKVYAVTVDGNFRASCEVEVK